MFILSVLKDTVRLVPELFDKELTAALTSVLNEKYSGRVLTNVGMCIQVYDILSYSDCVLHPGDGASYCVVYFRLVVFRPFSGEVLTGRIVASDIEKGVQVSVGFFDNIWVPPCNLRQKAVFDKEENLWTNEIEPADEDEQMDPIRNYLEIQQEVRLQSIAITFDTTTKAPKAEPETFSPKSSGTSELPMKVIGSFIERGLGPVEWWAFQEEE
eukprot:TRINITY_DN34051_c0_g1_i1.p1 TRINITY_DN34051_c0_g1~~TRINITY_DN34051_c0_g1_i1.p1  ORF type:complete len:213 (+),score=53.86 TRINITY_DN34051_c0_g1_i1:62-700(+)